MHVPHVPMLKERNVRTGFFEREQIDAHRRSPAAGDPSGCAVRVHHRLAHPERGPEAPVATRRLRGSRRPPGPAYDEERRGPDLPVHRRPRAAPGGSEGGARPTEGRGRDLSLGVQPIEPEGEGQADHDVHQGVHERRVRRRAVRVAFRTTCGGPPCATWCAPAFPSAWRCR